MIMTNSEIYGSWVRNGKTDEQIAILSQLNGCSTGDIQRIISSCQQAENDRKSAFAKEEELRQASLPKQEEVKEKVIAEVTLVKGRKDKRSKYSDETKESIKKCIREGKNFATTAQELGEEPASGSGFYQLYYKLLKELVEVEGIKRPERSKPAPKSDKQTSKSVKRTSESKKSGTTELDKKVVIQSPTTKKVTDITPKVVVEPVRSTVQGKVEKPAEKSPVVKPESRNIIRQNVDLKAQLEKEKAQEHNRVEEPTRTKPIIQQEVEEDTKETLTRVVSPVSELLCEVCNSDLECNRVGNLMLAYKTELNILEATIKYKKEEIEQLEAIASKYRKTIDKLKNAQLGGM